METYNSKNGKNITLITKSISKIDVVGVILRTDSFPILESILYIASTVPNHTYNSPGAERVSGGQVK